VKNRREDGRRGEAVAARHLADKGFRIIEQNAAFRFGELDIVAESPDGYLVFVEVKASLSSHAGDPAFKVDRKKQAQIYRMAEIYLAKNGRVDRKCRFDVVTVVFNRGEAPKVTHYENAFMR
jgi:putative endonuclease